MSRVSIFGKQRRVHDRDGQECVIVSVKTIEKMNEMLRAGQALSDIGKKIESLHAHKSHKSSKSHESHTSGKSHKSKYRHQTGGDVEAIEDIAEDLDSVADALHHLST